MPADFFDRGNQLHVVPRRTLVEIGRDEVKKKITKAIAIHLLWDTFMFIGITIYWVRFKWGINGYYFNRDDPRQLA